LSHYERENLIQVPQYHSSENSTSFDTLSLYKKRKVALQLTEKQIDSSKIDFGKEYILPASSNILLLKTNFKYSAAGLFTRYFFQAPFVYCTVNFADGHKKKFRTIVPIFESNHDLDLFYKNSPLNSVKSIQFDTKNSWGFLPEIDVKLTEVRVKH
jgi:hypothetical protein